MTQEPKTIIDKARTMNAHQVSSIVASLLEKRQRAAEAFHLTGEPEYLKLIDQYNNQIKKLLGL